MYIKSYKTDQFAGLINKHIDFEEGLNVILGNNESGKSTTIDGIYATLFKNIKLKRNNKSDLDFSYKYMSRPTGDYINGEIVLNKNNKDYRIKKEWGAQESIEFKSPDGSLIKDEDAAINSLNDILIFGESTYSNIIFTRQEDLKNSLNKIKEDVNLSKEITDVLRRTIMELDGISIQDIENNIQDEIETLYKRWDIQKQYPENNRGINNPYKTGLGLILESYYKKESLKEQMNQLNKFEVEYEKLSNQIKDYLNKLDEIKKEINDLEMVEEDIRKRAMVEIQIESLNKDLEDLLEANKSWPLAENELKNMEIKIDEIELNKVNITQEYSLIEQYRNKIKYEQQLEAMNKLENQKELFIQEIEKYNNITEDVIDEIENYESEIKRLNSLMNSGRLLAKVKEGNIEDIKIIKDLEEEETLTSINFESGGYLNIKYKNELEIEFKMIELDYEKIKEDFDRNTDLYKKVLKDCGSGDVNELKTLYKKNEEYKYNIRQIEDRIKMILDGESKDEIVGKLNKLVEIEKPRDESTLSLELDKINNEKINILSKKNIYKNQLDTWLDKYNSYEDLFDIIIEKKIELKEKEKEVSNLEKLPERFTDVEEFISRLQFLRANLNKYNDSLKILNDDYFELKLSMPEVSYEEIKKDYNEEEKHYDYLQNRGSKLLKIRKVFIETKNTMFENTMDPLVRVFLQYLDIITGGKYSSGIIDEDFNIEIATVNNSVPLDLLSAGTHDSVALALRLAIIKHLFKETGFFVLDDCLVDLDPDRKIKSIKLIQEFAKNYQVIFTTCDPITAEMLGGNKILI